MKYPELMTVMDAIEMADSLLESPDKDALETLRLTTPSRIPEDSMALYVAFMTLGTSTSGTSLGLDSKPMRCAQEVMKRSEYVGQAFNNPLPRNEVTRLLNILGNASSHEDFFNAVLRDPKTMHPSVDLALATEAIRRLMRDEWDHLLALTQIRQRLSVMRRR